MSIVEFEVFRKHFFCIPLLLFTGSNPTQCESYTRTHYIQNGAPPSQHLPVKSNTLYRRGSLPDNEQHFEFMLYQIRYRSCKASQNNFHFRLAHLRGPQIKMTSNDVLLTFIRGRCTSSLAICNIRKKLIGHLLDLIFGKPNMVEVELLIKTSS